MKRIRGGLKRIRHPGWAMSSLPRSALQAEPAVNSRAERFLLWPGIGPSALRHTPVSVEFHTDNHAGGTPAVRRRKVVMVSYHPALVIIAALSGHHFDDTIVVGPWRASQNSLNLRACHACLDLLGVLAGDCRWPQHDQRRDRERRHDGNRSEQQHTSAGHGRGPHGEGRWGHSAAPVGARPAVFEFGNVLACNSGERYDSRAGGRRA